MIYIYGYSGLIGRRLMYRLERRNTPHLALNHREEPPFRLSPGDTVIDLMCDGSPDKWTRARLTESTLHSLQLVKACARTGAHLLFASSSEIYDQRRLSDFTLKPLYRASKMAVEAAAALGDAPVTLMRFFNVYGSDWKRPDGRVIPEFISRAMRSETLRVHGDGMQVRCFTWVEDAVSAILMCGEKRIFGPVDIGMYEPRTVKDTALLVRDACGSQSELLLEQTCDDRIGTRRRVPDIERTFELLGWRANVPLRAGLRLAIDGGGNQ